MDNRLASTLGVMMRTLKVCYPSSMKLSVTRRVYRDGVLDTRMSSRQEHATLRPGGNQYLELGWLDPDVLTPEPQGKLKILGLAEAVWIKKPSDRSGGGFIDAPITGELGAGRDQLVMELAYGRPGPRRSSAGPGLDEIREGAIIRITIHARVDPLSAEELKELAKYPNVPDFNKGFKVDD